jgi:hypothetical protein
MCSVSGASERKERTIFLFNVLYEFLFRDENSCGIFWKNC